MAKTKSSFRARLMGGAAGVVLTICAGSAAAQEVAKFDIAPQSLADALKQFGYQSGHDVLASPALADSKVTQGVNGERDVEVALNQLLDGSGLTWKRNGNTFLIVSASYPQSGSAAGDGAEGTVQALIVTAQKREENIQDVPIAMSAFTQEALERSQVAGGPDLMTQVPNMTFTKTNFSSYSIQLRGIGTQAISATVDPAVAVAFNNTPFIRNRFFEQEFYDLQRIEVLRGPQGTLYGRNATAGVVNLISAKPKFAYEAKVSADVSNYNSTRIEGMLNIPLAEDMVALRIAGAWTKREGYSTNDFNGNPIDGRNLWSTRVSLRMAPSSAVDINLIWEHFQEDDDRLRSGKQLCKTDVVTSVAGIPTPDFYQTLPELGQSLIFAGVQGSFSQGCLPSSLYSPDSYQKTNAIALPYYIPLGAVQLPIAIGDNGLPSDPYASRTLSHDLRSVEAIVDPSYRAKTDVVELQFKADLTDRLTLSSETGWSSDFIFSTQDYNRFIGAPHAWTTTGPGPERMVERGILSPDGVFCDPQIGCSDRLVAMDLSTAKSSQFSQELRLASDFDGPFNFSLGGNFLRYDTEDKYYVFINSLSLISAYFRNESGYEDHTPYIPNVTDNRDCLPNGLVGPDFSKAQSILICTYIDPNPINNLNDLGHNYFLSKNPYKLISYAMFGEGYYNLTDNLKITAGLRWTVDKKEAPLIPSWVLATNTAGYPIVETVRQKWTKPTGRLAIDWKPDLGFTDQTMVYGSFSHGYKAGGMNPPPYGKAFYGAFGDLALKLAASSALHPKTFEPEYVNAFELGTKNTLLDGALTLNLASFYYDYKGYQLSQIVNRSAVTLNFDTDVWGVELESDWRPVENLRFGLKLGYEKTRVADGEKAIDVMDRTAGTQGWVLNKPFPAIPSNCVLPAWLFLGQNGLVNVGGKGGGSAGGCELAYILGYDPATANPFTVNPGGGGGALRGNVDYAGWSTDPADFPCWPTGVPRGVNHYPGVDPECLAALSNNGEGFYKDLSGKELPNAPHYTATLTADYTVPLPSDWLMTFHTDLYYQSEAWTRIFNTEGYDKLKAYTNVNLAAIFTNEEAGWKVMAYVKNIFDRDSITGAFLNSDDTGLTTNVFLTEPRLFGLRVTREWTGGPWWTGANPNHTGPFPLTVELSGQVQRHDAPNETLITSWAQSLPADLAPAKVQDADLDWGDGRSLKLTYRPSQTPWSVSGTVRYGRTNSGTTRTHNASADTIAACGATPGNFFYDFICGPGASSNYASFRNIQVFSWSDAEAHSREEHHIVDFAIGYDVGIGDVASTLSAGLRYVDFQSDTNWAANAQADWNVPDGWACFGGLGSPYCAPVSYHRHNATLTASRQFKGAGPMVGWDGGFGLWNGERFGKVRLEAALTGGVLFGDQKTSVNGSEVSILHEGQLNYFIENFPFSTYATVQGTLPQVGDPTPTQISFKRSRHATVPLADLSLGVSYDVGRVKVGAGYRWERYFDVLDVGQDAEKKADRTIDGPYFKVAVGFGG